MNNIWAPADPKTLSILDLNAYQVISDICKPYILLSIWTPVAYVCKRENKNFSWKSRPKIWSIHRYSDICVQTVCKAGYFAISNYYSRLNFVLNLSTTSSNPVLTLSTLDCRRFAPKTSILNMSSQRKQEILIKTRQIGKDMKKTKTR